MVSVLMLTIGTGVIFGVGSSLCGNLVFICASGVAFFRPVGYAHCGVRGSEMARYEWLERLSITTSPLTWVYVSTISVCGVIFANVEEQANLETSRIG